MENRYYAQSYAGVRSFLYKVFGWMSFALTVSGVTAYVIGTSDVLLQMIMGNRAIVLGLVVLQLVLVVALSAAIQSLSRGLAFTLFAFYSVLTGMTLSSIFAVYTMSSISLTFFTAAGMFGAMAIYGAFTKRDLTGVGTFLHMALFGMLIALFINFFVRSAAFDLAIAFIGVIVFAGLTAYDLQKIKHFAQRVDVEDGAVVNMALLAALGLYLDFLNLFLSLLRFMGDRK